MLRRHFAMFPVLVLSLALVGCETLESNSIDYKSARKAPTLEVPPDLTAPSPSDRYAVPDDGSRGSATLSTYNAERAGVRTSAGETREVLPKEAAMHVERDGSQRWLVIADTPEDLWPKIRNFWIEMGFVLDVDAPDIGVMETDWAEDRAKIPQDIIRRTLGKVIDGLYSTPVRDKFRTRLEAGEKAGTVDVFISHRGVMEIYPNEARDTTVWQPRAADPELEAEMLRRLMVSLGAEESYAQSEAGTAPQAERARIQKIANGATALEIDDPFDRAWRRVGLALDRINFTVEDRNRAEGVYFVRYIDPEVDSASGKDEGVLSKLAFWRSKEKPQAGSTYRIKVEGEGERSTVRVQTNEGAPDNSSTATQIISLLHDQLK